MKKHVYIGAIMALFSTTTIIAQNNNGQLDQLEELGTKRTVEIPVAGGATLSTDVFVPITRDSFVLSINILGQTVDAEIIPKGTQLVIYPEMIDSMGNLVPNPNPYQLPLLFSRTPYGKDGLDPAGYVIPLLGYSFVYQDVRGRFNSEGTNLPMYSDSWAKYPYNPDGHLLDMVPPNDPASSRFHDDGWDTYQYLLNDLMDTFDLDNDGVPETIAPLANGTLGGAGASAFAIPQFQLSASHYINPDSAGLKTMVAAIATAEHYRYTAYHNGVMREQLLYEWLRGQLFDIDDTISVDGSTLNGIHTPSDYGFTTKQEVLDAALDHISVYAYPTSPVANAYPNSVGRKEMDVNHAPVDAMGEGDPNGQFSRYTNMNVPSYHLTGWYDIFVDGQIETWNNLKTHTTGDVQQLHKIVIGPWGHTTLTMRSTGDQTYPENVADVVGIAADELDLSSPADLDLSQLLQLELVRWFRYTMNERGHVKLGEPIIRIPERQDWQNVGAFSIRIPSENYDISLPDFLNYLTGNGGLPDMPVEVDFGLFTQNVDVPLPNVGGVFPIGIGNPIQAPQQTDFMNDVPNVRLYVIGPTDSLPENEGVGNYWMESNEFPITQDITYIPMYLHGDGSLDANIPTIDEGALSYTHDPDNPVQTVGGGNLFIDVPDGSRPSHGQMNLADTTWVMETMDNGSVLQFETAILTDTMSMIGFPKATIYAMSEPQGAVSGETDTDFFIRIVDVYPDGREFLVVEGAVNARARAYAQSIYNDNEDIDAVYSNINAGEWYEYQFRMQPIAYTFGKQHRVKVLISSSNYPRYQSNANIPLEDGEFFRRQPNDGKTYDFQGQTYSPRIADNSLTFTPTQASRIELPLLNYVPLNVEEVVEVNADFDINIYPNPVINQLTITTTKDSDYEFRLYDIQGKLVKNGAFSGTQKQLNIKKLPSAVYELELIDTKTNKKAVKSIVKAK